MGVLTQLALVNHTVHRCVRKFNRVLNGQNMRLLVAVYIIHHRCQGGTFARAGGTGNQYQTIGFTRNLTEHNIGSVWTATYEDAALAAERSHYWPALTAGFANAKNPPLSGEAQDFLTNTLQDVANGRTEAAAAIESVNSAWASIPVPPALLEAAMGSDLAAE